MFRKLRLSVKMYLGFAIPVILMAAIAVLVWVEAGTVAELSIKTNMETVVYADLAQEMKLDVVQVQQWLTDISATGAADGLDDGFKEAEKYAQAFENGTKQFQEMYEREHDADGLRQIEDLREKFKAYYDMGKRMAKAYIDGGRDAGNKVMTEFDPFASALTESVDRFRQEQADELRQSMATIVAKAGELRIYTCAAGALAIFLASVVSWLIVRGITKPLNRIITGLNEGADQVNDAAAQVSTASQQLAEGASEQASSLEETSSALEQMAAMTRTNAGNSKEANELAGQAQKAAAEGDKTMHQLNAAMTGINESSDKISKIIKVIEEIAFQTNLLALNAAVEAARAGDHGKGFAVVADEVRNLAQRAAQAARETTGLIEDSVNKTEQGTQVAGEVAKSLGAIVADVSKVTNLIAGISQASQEQAQGVDQVNTAVSQMDKVTQQNAAGAEESASAAEQLSAQAASVKAVVDELSALVGGTNGRGESSAVRTQPAGFVAGKAKRRLGETVAGLRNKSPLKRASAARAPADAAPSKGRHAAADKSGEGVSEDFLALDNDKAIAEF